MEHVLREASCHTAGLEILAFPCNQFGGQEPGSNKEIKDNICTTFKGEFPIFDKVGSLELVSQFLSHTHVTA